MKNFRKEIVEWCIRGTVCVSAMIVPMFISIFVFKTEWSYLMKNYIPLWSIAAILGMVVGLLIRKMFNSSK